MAKAGRANAYDTIIKPHFDMIARMISEGCTAKKICGALGISEDTWYSHLKKQAEFSEFIKNCRDSLVNEVKSALKRKAVGFHFTETRRISEPDENGVMHVVRIEETEKYSPPDVAAANLLLKNYDTENWSNDPRADALKREEFEWKKQRAAETEW